MLTSPALHDFDPELRPTTTGPLRFEIAQAAIVWAIHERRLAETAAEIIALGDRAEDASIGLARAAAATCSAIAARITTEQDRTVDLLADGGVAAASVTNGHGVELLHQVVELEIESADVDTAVDLLERDGYLRWQPWTGAAWELHKRTHPAATLVRDDDDTSRVTLRWGPDPKRGLITRVVQPSAADLAIVRLPKPLWPLYYALRPARLAIRRLKAPPPETTDLGPFLGTPTSLIPALLEIADVGPNDVLFDLGCGDGRVLIEAVQRTTCRGVGIERSEELVARARAKAAEAGVADRIEILEADGESAGLDEATVVFLFLPAPVVRNLVPVLLERLSPGVRIIVHEQERLGSMANEPTATPVIRHAAVTVAHLWTVSDSDNTADPAQ